MDWLRVLPIGISTCPPSVAHVASGAPQLGGPPGGSPNWTRCSSQTASNASLKLKGRPEFDPGLAVPVVVPIHKADTRSQASFAGEWLIGLVGTVSDRKEQGFRYG